MPMVPCFTRLGDLALREMRTLTLLDSQDGIPAGEYGFLELYCNEEGCDCRRVHIQVVSPPPETRIWANINYGWESEEYYGKWGLPPGAGPSGAFLDPLNVQTQHAPAFLRLFEELCLTDAAYVRRLVRHYELFKAAPGPSSGTNRAARRQALRRARQGRGRGL